MTTTTMYAPNGNAGVNFTCRSGNNYTSNSVGFLSGVQPYDVTDLITDGCLPLGFQTPASFRNIIDCGDFGVNPWQRGTSFSALSASPMSYTADRWFVGAIAAANMAVSQVATSGVPSFNNALCWGRTSGDAHTGALYLGQVLETLDCVRLQGQQVTLSFYAQSATGYTGGSLTVALNHSTTSGNDSAANLVNATGNWQTTPSIINTTQAISSTWNRYSFTGTVPTNATQLGALLSFTPAGTAAGASGTAAGDSVLIQGVQLEVGPTATPFEHRDAILELEMAQRYFWQLNEPANGGLIAQGQTVAVGSQQYPIPTPVQMRIAPTVTVSAGSMRMQFGATSVGVASLAAGLVQTVSMLNLTTAYSAASNTPVQLIGGAGVGYIRASSDL